MKSINNPTLKNALANASVILARDVVCSLGVELSCFTVGWRVGIRVCEQALDLREDRRAIVEGRPRVVQYIEADASVSIDVGVEHFSQKAHFWRLLRKLLSKLHDQLEDTALPLSPIRPNNYSFQLHHTLVRRLYEHAHARCVPLVLFEVGKESSSRWCCHINYKFTRANC